MLRFLPTPLYSSVVPVLPVFKWHKLCLVSSSLYFHKVSHPPIIENILTVRRVGSFACLSVPVRAGTALPHITPQQTTHYTFLSWWNMDYFWRSHYRLLVTVTATINLLTRITRTNQNTQARQLLSTKWSYKGAGEGHVSPSTCYCYSGYALNIFCWSSTLSVSLSANDGSSPKFRRKIIHHSQGWWVTATKRRKTKLCFPETSLTKI